METDKILALAQFAPRSILTGYKGLYVSPNSFFAENPQMAKAAFFDSEFGTGVFVFDATMDNTQRHILRSETIKACSLERCGRIAYALEMCEPHYRKVRTANAKECSDMDCTRKVYAKGLCNMHYQRERNKNKK